MKLLTNQTGSYLTGDHIADAVMSYALALTRSHEVDLVDIPFITRSLSTRRVTLLVGHHNQITSSTHSVVPEELIEIDTIIDLYSKAHALGVVHAEPFTDEQLNQYEWPTLDYSGSNAA